MSRSQRTIGILTGGGDCPGLNAVIRAVVLTATEQYGWNVVGFRDAFVGLVEERWLPLDRNTVRGILPVGGTILGTASRRNPSEWKVEIDGELKTVDRSPNVAQTIKNLGIEALIIVGGDGTMAITQQYVERFDLKVIGVPKTIDNDLKATQVTFGYATAVVTATEAVDKLHTTAASHHRVMVLETMGRHVGWIALESGVSGGADVILIPEIPYDIDKVCDKILNRKSHGSRFSIVVVAEGAKPQEGEASVLGSGQQGTIHERLGGIGLEVAQQIQAKTNMITRATVLGHLQRGGSPCPFDRYLGTRFGRHAVELIAQEKYGRMVRYQNGDIGDIPIAEVIGGFKAVDPDGEAVKTAEALGTSFGR